MKAPTHLHHKPIITVDDYDAIDGKYVKNTDAKALSVGKSQWDEADLSAKVWRHTGDRWSRQSEELPLHRVLDLCILTISSFMIDPESDFPITSLGEKVFDKEGLTYLRKYFSDNEKKLLPRIEELKRVSALFIEKQHSKKL
jgi:hypothetical protein